MSDSASARIGVVTVSDRASRGEYEDRGGPAIRDYLAGVLTSPFETVDRIVPDERESVIEALWEVVLADGVRDHEEDALLRLVAPMLGVNDRDSNLARRRVEARRG